MKELIRSLLGQPHELEKLYRTNKTAFVASFKSLYPEVSDQPVAQCWNERLNHTSTADLSWGSRQEQRVVVGAALASGLLAKLPDFFGLRPDIFYLRNLGLLAFPALFFYFAWKNKLTPKFLLFPAIIFAFSAIYINLLPGDHNTDTLRLAAIHLPILLWGIWGYAFLGGNTYDWEKRIDFLRFNGDFLVTISLLQMAAGMMTAITFGLFTLIGWNIAEFYLHYVVVFGLAALPTVAAAIVSINPQLVNKVAPLVAKLFAPLVVIMLVVYLFAFIGSALDPFKNRESLLIFNLLLIGVMALILFSLVGLSAADKNRWSTILLLSLSVLTILINSIALSAIIYRISQWGFTPNRLAVLGSNILILIHLALVGFRLFHSVRTADRHERVLQTISSYLPVYLIWAAMVTFLFPVLFSFR